MLDRILIKTIRCHARLGVSEEERASPQPVEIDVWLDLILEPAVHTDSLDMTVDYFSLTSAIRSAVTAEPCALVEALAGRVCDLVLADPRVEGVGVEVRKFPRDMEQDVDYVSVTLKRSRTR